MPDRSSSTVPVATDRAIGRAIELEHVSKLYPGQTVPAVDDISMSIPAGEIVVFVGPSGCGKTTTMKMINRLIEPTSGRITIGGVDVQQLEADGLRRQIGYVIQQIGLFPHMRVAENIALVPKVLGWDRRRIDDRVAELLELVGLSDEFAGRYPKELSGGQQQRVGVARALAADPPVLLMDEPFGATDPITRERLQNEFLRLQQELGKTIVFVTHDFDEALKLGDRIAVLRSQSKIAQFDTPQAVLADPADEYVAGFIGAGGHLKQLAMIPLSEVDLRPVGTAAGWTGTGPAVSVAGTMQDALDTMLGSGGGPVLVVRGDPGASGAEGGQVLGLLESADIVSAVTDRSGVVGTPLVHPEAVPGAPEGSAGPGGSGPGGTGQGGTGPHGTAS